MTEHDNTIRRAAEKLLAKGLASPSDISHLAGVSRQVVNYWIAAANIDWRKAYNERLRKAWDRIKVRV